MIVLSVTPLAWAFLGRQPETYPELLFFLWGVPWALCLTSASIFIAIRGRNILAWRPFGLAACGCFLLPAGVAIEIAAAYSHLRLPRTLYLMAQGAMIANWCVLVALLATGLYGVLKKPS